MEGVILADLEGGEPPPKKRRKNTAPARGGAAARQPDAIADDPGVGGGGGAPPTPPAIGLPHYEPGGDAPSPTPDGVLLADPDSGEERGDGHREAHSPPRRDWEPGAWRETINGIKMKYTRYRKPKSTKEYTNWQLKCTDPAHGYCLKTKGATDKFTERYGPVEPVLFLHAWHRIRWPSRPGITTHRQEEPTDAEVDAVAADCLGDLQAVHDSIAW
jgi:hypothetical protein